MKKMIFMNLLIDQIWDNRSVLSQAFQIQNPESIRTSRLGENLSIYTHVESDLSENIYLLSLAPDRFWLEHFPQLKNLRDIRFQVFNSQPLCVSRWIQEFESKLRNMDFKKCVFSGISELEKEIGKKVQAEIQNLEFPFAKINSKGYLLGFCESQNILFPESRLIRGKDFESLSTYEKKQYLFKNSVSAGGAGIFDMEKINAIYPWIQRNNLMKEWNESQWLMQKRHERLHDFSIFGHTDSDQFKTVEVLYNQAHLSSAHIMNCDMPTEIKSSIRITFEKVRQHLASLGYHGPFGFDSFQTTDGTYYPLIDLNVRMTKTHLLFAAYELWKPRFPYNKIVRLRFQNPERKSFQDSWTDLVKHYRLDQSGSGQGFQLLPVDVSGWAYGQAEATWILACADKETCISIEADLKQMLSQDYFGGLE